MHAERGEVTPVPESARVPLIRIGKLRRRH